MSVSFISTSSQGNSAKVNYYQKEQQQRWKVAKDWEIKIAIIYPWMALFLENIAREVCLLKKKSYPWYSNKFCLVFLLLLPIALNSVLRSQ
jgi:hypothetical protein